MTEIKWWKHHIVPRHVGGTDDPSNILKCNTAMHAFLHEQLYKEYGRWQDKLAYKGLRGLIGKDEIHREIMSKNGKKTGRQVGLANRGLKRTKEQRQRMSDAQKGKTNIRGVTTPDGHFKSLTECAEYYGITPQTASWRSLNWEEWKRDTV